MNLLIDDLQLQLLLEKKRNYIGKKVAIDTIIAGISFLLSTFTASYSNIFNIENSGLIIKTIFCLIGIVYSLKIIYDIVQSYKNKYNHRILLKDIEGLNMIQHNHSLVAIKNTFNNTSNKFLVYYDERWDCKLFPNYKTIDTDNEAALIDYIAADLDCDKRKINCKYITSRIQSKYSYSHNENRIYNHRLYEINISHFPERIKHNDFTINGKQYYWMSISDMERDENILKKNKEVVDFIKENLT